MVESKSVDSPSTSTAVVENDDSDASSMFINFYNKKEQPFVYTIILGIQVKFLVDSGAGATLINISIYARLGKPVLTPALSLTYGFARMS